MSDITIRIVTPKAVAFEGQSDMVTGPGFNGLFGVLKDHTQFLTLSEPGIISLGKDGSGASFAIGKGFAEVADNVVTFLVDECISKEDADGSLEAEVERLKSAG